MAKSQEKDKTFRTGSPRQAKVFAQDCIRNAAHKKTRVYRTGPETTDKETGQVFQRRYCVCDECGETWFQDGPPVNQAV